MSTRTSLSTELCDQQRRLDNALRCRVGISVELYKALTFIFRAVGIVLLVIPYYLPDVQPLPRTALFVLAAFVLGPDIVEEYLTRNGGGDT